MISAKTVYLQPSLRKISTYIITLIILPVVHLQLLFFIYLQHTQSNFKEREKKVRQRDTMHIFECITVYK